MADSTKTTTIYDPLEGVTAKTTKEELMGRLRDAAAAIRRQDRSRKSSLQEIEDKLRAKTTVKPEELRQIIVSATVPEWRESVEFLEEFSDLLPVSLQRLVIGTRVLLGQFEAAG